jgi:hypothetical protein
MSLYAYCISETSEQILTRLWEWRARGILLWKLLDIILVHAGPMYAILHLKLLCNPKFCDHVHEVCQWTLSQVEASWRITTSTSRFSKIHSSIITNSKPKYPKLCLPWGFMYITFICFCCCYCWNYYNFLLKLRFWGLHLRHDTVQKWTSKVKGKQKSCPFAQLSNMPQGGTGEWR